MTQAEALNILKTGANVFLTGEPGSGKTHTTNEYIRWLRERGIEPAVTASTGIAATHNGGQTIHSWSGIGIRTDLSPYELDKITQDERRSKKIRTTHVLIIDEVSMLSANVLGMVDVVCREVRGRDEPFGGVQVILVGDFFQLPPIEKGGSDMFGAPNPSGEKNFAYRSPVWEKMRAIVCYLHEQHRQEDDTYLEILTAIRNGTVSASHHALLNKRKIEKSSDTATQLFSHNMDVDRINDAELAKLPGNPRTYTMTSRGAPPLIEQLKRGCLSPEFLSLKIGARVMFTKNNFEEGYVNGTLGIVESFSEAGPVVKTRSGKVITVTALEWNVEDSGKILAKITQLPLRLAWAITVHKSQGMSLDAAHMDLSRAFEYGQGYVALSRVRTLSGVSLVGINERALQVHPAIAKQDVVFRSNSKEAGEAFTQIPAKEITEMHNNFVKASGGKLTPQKVTLREMAEKRKGAKKGDSLAATLTLVQKKLPIEKIAAEKGVTLGTILTHIESLYIDGKIGKSELAVLFKNKQKAFPEIHKAFYKLGADKLKPIFEYFKGKVSYDDIKMARLVFEK